MPMSKPKNMTPEQEAVWLAKQREKARNRPKRKRKPDPNASKRTAKWRAKNQKLANERARKSRLKKHEEYKARERETKRRIRETQGPLPRNPARESETAKKSRSVLKDWYVAKLLELPVDLLREHLPNLLESKRQELLLKRQLNPKHNK
jgi:hypothetical protein